MNATSIFHAPTLLVLLVSVLSSVASARASVVINSTRIVYPQNDKEVTVRLESKNQAPVLIQAWLDDGDENATPDLTAVPFIATPPIFRMDPGKQQVLRLAYTGDLQPGAQERLFWLNLLEVPSQPADAPRSNQLQLAFRSRIKLFLRPPNLAYAVEAAPAKLQWRYVQTAQGQVLEAYNPSPYHVTFEHIELRGADQRPAYAVATYGAGTMVAPGARSRFALPGFNPPPAAAATVAFQTLDDFGVKVSHQSKVAQ